MSLNSKFKINTVFHVYVESKNNTNEQTQQNINRVIDTNRWLPEGTG